MRPDFYRVLGVHPSSEDIVIRAAYRVLAQRYHPDKCFGQDSRALSRMQEINEAYAVLSDRARRREYDENLGASGSGVFSDARVQPDWSDAGKSDDIAVSDLRNRARLKETFLAVQELQRRMFRAGQINAVA
jgi:curved DNA-binding protein CbpA